MEILKSTNVEDIKNWFSDKYPGLKIEFFKTKHDKNMLSPESDEIFGELTVDMLNPDLNEGNISPEPYMTVSDFEGLMAEFFGLHVQVYRRSGKTYIQTSKTDHWTLEKQNEMAV